MAARAASRLAAANRLESAPVCAQLHVLSMLSICKPMASKSTHFRFIGRPIPRTEDVRTNSVMTSAFPAIRLKFAAAEHGWNVARCFDRGHEAVFRQHRIECNRWADHFEIGLSRQD